VRRVDEVRKNSSPAKSLIVQMSEPVDTSDLLSGGLKVLADGKPQNGCIVWNGKCLERSADNPALTGFEYRMNAETPSKFILRLASGVRGRDGKKVGDTANKVTAVRAAATQAELSLDYPFDRSVWRQRRAPQVFGWSNAE
jgi:hypothetical protein